MFQSLCRPSGACLRHATKRFYSGKPVLPSRDWRTAGHPAPPSILDDTAEPADLSEDNEAVNGAHPGTPPLHRRAPPTQPTPHEHASHRKRIKQSFPQGWSPPRKLSREAMDGLRQLHQFDETAFSTPVLAEKFRISPEAVRRILKSKWEPTREQRSRFAKREREKREAFIQTSRMEERMRAVELEREKYTDRRDGWDNDASGRVRGINSKDKLTFQ